MRFKQMWICIAISAALALTVCAVGSEEITALLNREITIVYGGEVERMYDEAGAEVYPISYGGTTYLPIRAICNMLSVDIVWDEEANLVSIADSRASQKNDPQSRVEFEVSIHYDGTVRLDRYRGAGGAVVIPDGITEIGDGAFDGVIMGKLGSGIPTSIYIPDSVEKIGSMAFFALVDAYGNGLTEVRMSQGIREIGNMAFAECSRLEAVYFDSEPTHEINVGSRAFAYCEKLERCDLVGLVNVSWADDSLIGTIFDERNYTKSSSN